MRKKPAPDSDASTPAVGPHAPPSAPNTIRVLETSLRRPLDDDPELAAALSAPSRPLLHRFNSPLRSGAQPLTPTSERASPDPMSQQQQREGQGQGQQQQQGTPTGTNMPVTPATVPQVSVTHSSTTSTTKRLRQRWHFGIRSRSEPMEVMLEIYRTLKALKMEWRVRREGGEEGEAGAPCPGGAGGGAGGEGKKEEKEGRPEESEKRRRRREEEERIKKAHELYFVETRCRMDDVMVRSS